jgi:hypothetical protein
MHYRLFEIARVLVRFDHIARGIVNANDGVMRTAVLLGIADCVRNGLRSVIRQPTKWQRIGNQIEAVTAGL